MINKIKDMKLLNGINWRSTGIYMLSVIVGGIIANLVFGVPWSFLHPLSYGLVVGYVLGKPDRKTSRK